MKMLKEDAFVGGLDSEWLWLTGAANQELTTMQCASGSETAPSARWGCWPTSDSSQGIVDDTTQIEGRSAVLALRPRVRWKGGKLDIWLQ